MGIGYNVIISLCCFREEEVWRKKSQLDIESGEPLSIKYPQRIGSTRPGGYLIDGATVLLAYAFY
jgi:hypothetical protein